MSSSGHRLGRYTLVAPLGEGGMATVHVARKDGDPRVCVLKQLHEQLAEHEETNRRFHREAHIASFLSHPGIAHVVDAGVEDGIFCIALEFIAGQTVEQMVRAARSRGGTLPFEVTIHVMLQALEALAHAHELMDHEGRSLGLVHRDLSPRNVMVGYDGRVKIIDFGIAKGRVDDHRTAVGVLMGTPYYMSPEQARAVEIDHRSDIYTLGAVLFEMLTGHRLVSAKGRAKILMSVVRDPAPPLSSRNPHAPPELEAVLARALAKRPGERFPSARAFRDALLDAYEAGIARTRAGPAVSRLHPVTQEQVGQFLRELMPEGEAKARELLAQVREVAPVEPAADATRLAARGSLDGPAVVPTRLADPESFNDPTRAADSSELAEPTRAAHPGELEAPGEEPALEPTMFGLPGAGDPPRSAATTGPSSASPFESALGPPRRRRRAGVIAAAGVAVLGLGAAALAVTLLRPSEPRPAPTARGSAAALGAPLRAGRPTATGVAPAAAPPSAGAAASPGPRPSSEPATSAAVAPSTRGAPSTGPRPSSEPATSAAAVAPSTRAAPSPGPRPASEPATSAAAVAPTRDDPSPGPRPASEPATSAAAVAPTRAAPSTREDAAHPRSGSRRPPPEARTAAPRRADPSSERARRAPPRGSEGSPASRARGDAPPPPAPSEGALGPATRAELGRLERQLGRLRREPTRAGALALAEAVYGAAEQHLEGRSRARARAEAERVMRTSSLDGMIEALESALSALRAGLAGS